MASQPITTVLRGPDGALFVGVDSAKATSGLWKSTDDGLSWADTHGRTVGRHTTFFTAATHTDTRSVITNHTSGNTDNSSPHAGAGAGADAGAHMPTIFAFGGKNSDIDGYMPYTFSKDGGATFAPGAKLPFPALGGNQRPCVHRLLSGNLVFIGDLQVKGSGKQPSGWKGGTGVYAALSRDDGATWKIRPLPISLPHELDQLSFGTLGYSTVRQGPNGVIHILSTMTHPCLHYEINEAWILAGSAHPADTAPVDTHRTTAHAAAETRHGKKGTQAAGSRVTLSSQTSAGGRMEWGAKIGDNAYLLDGTALLSPYIPYFITTFPFI